VHPRGARHMIDPAALAEGARAVYGDEEMERWYGEPVPVAAERVLPTRDGMTLSWGRRTLQFIDTPGHARHHHCVWDDRSRSFFTGDTFGLSYREFDTDQGAFVLPTTSPVQFEPDALRASIERMLTYRPEAMYLTHYGRVTDVPRLAALLLSQMDDMVMLAGDCAAGPARHEALKQALTHQVIERLHSHGCALEDGRIVELLSVDLELNAQGLAIWADRRAGACS
jgi:glyoxylase-like metal-dependent hydrolase (beta-lactamase superfamily II)